MGGLVDLLFFGLLLWFVFRAAGRATEQARAGSGEGGEVEAGGEARGERRRRAPGAPTGSGEPGFRDRLVEELRRWEAEQRARRPPVESRLEPPVDPRVGAEAGPPEPARPAPPARPTEDRLAARVSRPAAGPSFGDDRARPAAPGSRPRREAATGGLRRRGGLPELSRHTPLQRAVVLAEILGRPPGLRG